MSNTNQNTDIVEWRDIDWRKAERYVFKLQKRIYKASRFKKDAKNKEVFYQMAGVGAMPERGGAFTIKLTHVSQPATKKRLPLSLEHFRWGTTG